MQRSIRDPIEELRKSLDKIILIKIKKNRLFRGELKSFDQHLNLFLDQCTQIYEIENENGELVEEREELGQILIRGDNVVFIEFGQ
ncbi:MAG: RNA-binding protein [Candidatus Lokiarchaeota archaeon]|nr:RNA-binding protein [Candidatus Lokiarchaeota archaeon]